VDRNLFSKLLVMVDGSESSTAAADFAGRLAQQTGARLHAVYVVDTATMDYLMQLRIFVAEERQECEKDLERTGARYLEYARAVGRKHGVEVETHLRKGPVDRSVLQAIRELGVDALIMGGWCGGVSHKDATCTARQLILAEALCPVIVIKTGPGAV
jgi:nucleotide-binding universal stress UspA family protein